MRHLYSVESSRQHLLTLSSLKVEFGLLRRILAVPLTVPLMGCVALVLSVSLLIK